MQARLFAALPADINNLILSRLSLRELLRLRLTHQAGRANIDAYLQYHVTIDILNQSTREDVALYLRHFYSPGSDAFHALQQEALDENVTVARYALYALVADVTTLDADRLLQTIEALRAKNYCPNIITSLTIIHHYLTHGNPDFDKELKQLIADANGAYINLRGATIVNNFYQLDLSYCNLSESHFYSLVSRANLCGANFTNATFDGRTIMSDTKTANMIVEGLTLGNGFVIESEMDPETNEERFTIPELAPLMRKNAKQPEEKRCTIL